MKNIPLRRSRPRQLLLMLAILCMTCGGNPAGAQDVPVLNLNPGDVHKAVVLVTKPNEITLEVTYSKPKQAEFLKLSQEGLPKPVRIALNGQVVSERTLTQPLTGHSLKVARTSLDQAFAEAKALLQLSASGSPTPLEAVPPGDTAVLLEVPAQSITKFAVFMYQPATVWMDFSLGDKEKAALAELESKNPGKTIIVSLDGKSLGKMQTPGDKAGSSVRVPAATIDEAMVKAKAVMNGAH